MLQQRDVVSSFSKETTILFIPFHVGQIAWTTERLNR